MSIVAQALNQKDKDVTQPTVNTSVAPTVNNREQMYGISQFDDDDTGGKTFVILVTRSWRAFLVGLSFSCKFHIIL